LINTRLLNKRTLFLNPYDLLLKDDKIQKPYIEFSLAEKIVSIYGGCSQLLGKFEKMKNNIKFLNLKDNRKPCPNTDLEALQNEFLSKLERVTRYELQGEKLNLYGATDYC
jgi:heat shock protein HslJ